MPTTCGAVPTTAGSPRSSGWRGSLASSASPPWSDESRIVAHGFEPAHDTLADSPSVQRPPPSSSGTVAGTVGAPPGAAPAPPPMPMSVVVVVVVAVVRAAPSFEERVCEQVELDVV